MGDLFDRFFGPDWACKAGVETFGGSVEVFEGREEVRVVAEVGDFECENLRVELRGRTLLIEGARPGDGRGHGEGSGSAAFVRRIQFCTDFDAEKVVASLSGGRLTIVLPRSRSDIVPVRIRVE